MPACSKYDRELLPAFDGNSVVLDWASEGADLGPASPIVLVMHGIVGSAEENYCRNVVKLCLKRGCVANRRASCGSRLTHTHAHCTRTTRGWARMVVCQVEASRQLPVAHRLWREPGHRGRGGHAPRTVPAGSHRRHRLLCGRPRAADLPPGACQNPRRAACCLAVRSCLQGGSLTHAPLTT